MIQKIKKYAFLLSFKLYKSEKRVYNLMIIRLGPDSVPLVLFMEALLPGGFLYAI